MWVRRMTLPKPIRALPLFWQVYLFIVSVLIVVVGLAEMLLEPLVEMLVFDVVDFDIDLYEVPVWAFSIFVPSLACGFFISRKLTRRLETTAGAARALARGNLTMRLPESGNERDVFDDLARSFNQMADAIERQLRNERRLLADVAHELRAPLARMAIAAELLGRKQELAASPTPSSAHPSMPLSTVGRLEKEIRQMGSLVATLLAQGRERIVNDGEMEALDVGTLLAAALEDCAFLGKSLNKTVSGSIEDGLSVVASVSMLQGIFQNILANAVFYTPPGSTVLLTARRNGHFAEVTVRDAGPGVPEDHLQDIFRAFYRVDDSRARSSGGAGLGLALAKDAAIRLGGDISARNLSPGLEVTIVLPLS